MKNNIATFLKRHWIFSIIVVTTAVPLLIQILMTTVFSSVNGGSNDGWLGFWGGYLGSLLGIAGTVGFTIYYSDKQLEINREAQVQAYLKQSQIKALRDYEVCMLDAYDKFMEASYDFESSADKTTIMESLNETFEDLNDKCSKYQLLAFSDESSAITTIQNELAAKFSKLWFSGTTALENLYAKSVDDEENEILIDKTGQAVKQEAERFSDFATDLLKSTNDVKAFFDNTFKQKNNS
ncbi:hypothetical protein [Lactiplantibacillus pentosus]|uniref:hypothetical protein n=1 Tax=Lactiplantibacillus pentosus TaxID=1589 RepID=UPI003D2F396F